MTLSKVRYTLATEIRAQTKDLLTQTAHRGYWGRVDGTIENMLKQGHHSNVSTHSYS